MDGLEYVDKVIGIDQQPIGRTPRSNPATYTGVFNDIRAVFAQTQDAKMRGYGPGRFSFNVKGGRCEACEGNGILQIEMHFLPDVYVPCEVCKGARYNRETLEVKYKEKTIADVLNMTVEEAVVFFANQPKIARKLQTTGVTSKMELRYLKPVHTTDEYLVIRGTIAERKRNIVTVDACIYDQAGEPCTKASCTYFTFSKEKALNELHFSGCEVEKEDVNPLEGNPKEYNVH